MTPRATPTADPLERDELATSLGDLRVKYQEMRRLRLAHRAGDPEDPRPAMAALAAKFPGALREIDELPLAEIELRIEALARAEAGRGAVASWMRATALFHALTRGVLSAKRWLRGRKDVDDSVRDAFVRAAAGLPFPDDARGWASRLDRVARPPQGRVTVLVYERIAETMRVTPGEAKLLVFGLTRRERTAARGRA